MPNYKKMRELIARLSRVNEIRIEDICEETAVSKRTLLRYLKEIRDQFPELDPHCSEGKVILKKTMTSLTPSDDWKLGTVLDTTPLSVIYGEKDDSNRGMEQRKKQFMLPNLFRAQKDGIYADVEYKSRQGVKKHRVAPLKFFTENLLVYIGVLEVTEHNGPILLALDKILSVKLCGAGPDKKLAAGTLKFIESGWGKMFPRTKEEPREVKFRVDQTIIDYFLKDPLHASQEIRPDKSGGAINMKVHNFSEFARFTVRYGRHLKLLQPKELVDEMRGFLKDMGEYYAE